MSRFSLSKVDDYRYAHSKKNEDIIDIKFPAELEEKSAELLIYIVEDDPRFLQVLNTHLSKLALSINDEIRTFKVKNFATGNSCIREMDKEPDLIFLNFYINEGLPNVLTGRETLDKILNKNPEQKVVILNDLEEKLQGAFIENGLRDFIIRDEAGLSELNKTILDVLS